MNFPITLIIQNNNKTIFTSVVLIVLLFFYNTNYSQKINSKLANNLFKESEVTKKYKVRILVNDEQSFLDWNENKKNEYIIIRRLSDLSLIVETSLSVDIINNLTSKKWVVFIDNPKREVYENGFLLNFDPTLNGISKAHSIYPFYSGENSVIGIRESSFNFFDIDFKGRIVNNLFLEIQDFSKHANEMATIATGAGNTSSSNKGVAWQSLIFHSEINNLMPDINDTIFKYKVTVQNHSYGVGIENYYGIESYLYDQQSHVFPKLLHVFSAGNKGEEISKIGTYANVGNFGTLTGQFKNSKNSITVGATDAYGNILNISSKGPANDGRIKPEVVAYGLDGSSGAAAIVSGTGGILQDAYYKKFGQLPSSSLIKALLINGAKNKNILNFSEGYGNINSYKSLLMILDGNLIGDSISGNEIRIHSVHIPEEVKNASFTLVWNDPPGLPESSRNLVNDLNLSIQNNNKVWLPWVLSSHPKIDSLMLNPVRGKDSINNVEKVSIENPESGDYLIKIDGNVIKGSTQTYSLVYSFDSNNIEWLFPVEGSSLFSNKEILIRWETNDTFTENAKLEFRILESNNLEWITIDSNVDIKSETYLWKIPEMNGLAELRLIYKTNIITSGVFSITNSLQHRVEYYCNGIAAISWPKQQGIEEYNVYQMGNNNFDIISTVRDTIYKFNIPTNTEIFVSVAPVLDLIQLGRTSTTLLNENVACYFNAFYLNKPFGNLAEINLSLNSKLEIKHLQIERLEGDKFIPIRIIDNLNDFNFNFRDESPLKGTNIYRSSIITNDGNIYYSEFLNFLSIENNSIILAPVPSINNSDIGIYLPKDGTTTMEILDISGRFISSLVSNSLYKTIETSSLKAGVYILKVIYTDQVLFKKFIVQ